MMEFRLDVYSHYVKVTGFSKYGKEALLEFCKPLAQYGLVRLAFNRYVRKMLRIFAASTKDRREFRFHIHQLESLVEHLKEKSNGPENINIVYHPAPEPVIVIFKVSDDFTTYDYQEPIVEYTSNEQKINVLTLQTGKGKTFIGLKTCEILGVRTMLVVKGQYIEQWVESYVKTMVGKTEDLMVVRGAKHLHALIDLALNGNLEAKFIIISSKTMYNYIQEYEATGGGDGFTYACNPDVLCEILGVGVRLIDEAHQLFHLNFRLDLYTNVRKTINLTATLKSSDPFKNRVYSIAYPERLRYKGLQYDKYIAVKALTYTLQEPGKLIYTAKGRGSYSHMRLEQSIMKDSLALERYIRMIVWLVQEEFLKSPDYKKGMKCLLFFSTKDLCTILTERFSDLWPDLNVQRYIDEDNYFDMLKGDIIVSTLQSAGTAVDIPGLYVSLMTVALGSRELNEQALGRTRRLKEWPHVTPKFVYLVCINIDKHVDYHESKKEFFKDKVLSHQELTLPFKL